eukprot:gene25191-28478_t
MGTVDLKRKDYQSHILAMRLLQTGAAGGIAYLKSSVRFCILKAELHLGHKAIEDIYNLFSDMREVYEQIAPDCVMSLVCFEHDSNQTISFVVIADTTAGVNTYIANDPALCDLGWEEIESTTVDFETLYSHFSQRDVYEGHPVLHFDRFSSPPPVARALFAELADPMVQVKISRQNWDEVNAAVLAHQKATGQENPRDQALYDLLTEIAGHLTTGTIHRVVTESSGSAMYSYYLETRDTQQQQDLLDYLVTFQNSDRAGEILEVVRRHRLVTGSAGETPTSTAVPDLLKTCIVAVIYVSSHNTPNRDSIGSFELCKLPATKYRLFL